MYICMYYLTSGAPSANWIWEDAIELIDRLKLFNAMGHVTTCQAGIGQLGSPSGSKYCVLKKRYFTAFCGG